MAIQIKREKLDPEGDSARVYHVKDKLTELMVEVARVGQNNSAIALGGAVEFPPVTNGVLEALVSIPGVEMVELHPYYAVILKAKMWGWSEIEPSIKRLFAALQLPLDNVTVDKQQEQVTRPDET